MKRYPADISFASSIKKNWLLNKFNNLFIRLLKIDFIKIEYAYRFKKVLPKLKNFDVVQFINEDFLNASPKAQIKILKQLKEQNKKLFLLCCGEDYTTINYYLKQTEGYSVMTPFLENKHLKNVFSYSLKYITKPYKALHEALKLVCEGTITSDIDYHLPMQKEANYLGFIPNPINTDLIKYQPLEVSGKINVFLGINTLSQIKKGSSYFESALKIIQQKYPDKVTVKITKNLPYKEYIKVYNEAHILLDQVYSYDQGYNALEAMAKGKVVFTGAEKEWLDHYNLEEDTVAINALPDVDYLVKKIEYLILNPEQIIEISKNAHAFVLKEHQYTSIAKAYETIWKGDFSS